MKPGTTIIIVLALILAITVIVVLGEINADILEINETLERQLILNENQDTFNAMVAEHAVTRQMLQEVLDNFYNFLMEQIM